MNEYINLTLENIDEEHICCAIGDKKHQAGVDSKKEWIKSKLKDGHIFRKLNARGKIFIEYEPIETAWIPISGKNYEYIYCLWVAGSFKGKGIGKELIEYAINDSKEKGKSGICTLVSKKKKPFIGEKKFFEHYGFKVVDSIADYELLALQFEDGETPKFNDNARTMKIDNQDFTIYYSNECPYVEYEVNELTEYAKENNIKINFIKIDSLEKAKNAPCIFNNWANFYKGKFISNTILNANSFKKLIVTASWPVMASTTRRISWGWMLSLIFFSSSMSCSSMCRRPAVSRNTMSFPWSEAYFSASRAICTGSPCPISKTGISSC